MATSLGEGIGLQNSTNLDNYWARSVFEQGAAKKAANEKADADLIKQADFGLDYSKALPVYANQMAQIQRDVLQKIAVARQNNKSTAKNVVANDLLQANMQLGKLAQDNARAMAYISDDKTVKDSDVVNKLVSPSTTFDDIASINDGQFFMTDATGTFAYRGVPKETYTPKFDKYTVVGKPTGNYKMEGNQRFNELTDSHTTDSINAEIGQMATDRAFQQNVMFQNRKTPIPEGRDPKDFMMELVNKEAEKRVMQSIPKGATTWKPATVTPPRESSGANKEKRIPSVQENVSVSVFNPETQKTTDAIIPYQINVSDKNINPIVISSSGDILDVTTNKRVSDNATNLSFKPENIQLKSIKHGDKISREWYVVGVATDIAKAAEQGQSLPKNDGESDESYAQRLAAWQASKPKGEKAGTKKTTFNVTMPLKNVAGEIGEVYDLSILDELKARQDKSGSPKPINKTSDQPKRKLY
jgi:hypothetical protein